MLNELIVPLDHPLEQTINRQRKTQRRQRTSGRDSSNAFTLIELVVIVIIIGILAAIALPSFINAQDNAREAAVKVNMRTAQMAAESYATDSSGVYPVSAADENFRNYFPGGSCSQGAGGKPGRFPVNPFSGEVSALKPGNVVDVKATRSSKPAVLGAAGDVFYNSVTENGKDGSSYAIQGAGKNGTAIVNPKDGNTLVISNQ